MGSFMAEHDQAKVEALRTALKRNGIELPQDYNDDWTLQKWLTAWDYDMNTIVPKMQHTIQFRTAMQFEDVPGPDQVGLDEWDAWTRARFNNALIDYYPTGICGYAKNGDVIVIEATGQVDPKGLAHSVPCSEFLRLRLVCAERIRKLILHQEQKLNKRCGLLFIIDSDGLNMDQLWMTSMHIYLCLVTLLQEHFPDMLNHILVIKAPSLVQVAYRMISPVLSKRTKEKVQIIHDSKWQETLLQHISSDTLPAHWGGTFIGPNQSCYGHVLIGGKVPTAAYLAPAVLDNMQVFNVGRGTKLTEEIQVESDRQDRQLHWRFHCPSGDLYFRIYYKTKNQNEQLIYPRLRVNTEFVVDEGNVSASKEGIIVMEFDNTHSYVKSKTLMLHHRLV